MSKQIALTRDLIDSIEKQSFFAWVHFYCMHMPGFDDKILSRKDGSWTERYRSSLQWLDQQMGHLLAYLEQRGLADHTLVVFAADHGEGLGDNRVQTHGPTVFDEEVRVPLVIHVPGQPGRYIDATVGNIDIVPTLFELLGAEPNNNHRGQSLVPLLTGEVDDWTESYYIENNNRSQVALVEKDHKLIWDQKADLYHRFNLDIDETEDHSIYGADPQEDNRMLMGLVHKNPSLFLAEIEHEETKKELARAWKVADDPAASSALDLLLFLSAKQPTTGVIEDVVTLFETTDDDTVRFMILRHMFATDREAWSRRIEEHLRPLSSTEAELTFIRGLAANGQDEFSAEFVYDRAHWWVEHGLPEHWEPWLRLISGWKKSSDTQLESTLALMLERSNKPPIPNTQPIPSSVLVQIIHNLAATAPLKLPQVATARIQRILLELLGHRDLPVQIATCYALGKIGDDVAIKHLEDILTNTAASIRLRQTALYSIVRRRRVAAISLIEKYGHEPFLTVDAVNHMRWIRHPDGIPFLKHIATNYYNPLIRKRAKKAIAAIKSAKK